MISKLLTNLIRNSVLPIFIGLLSFNGLSQGTLEASGNGIVISSGSSSPSVSNLTDFGNVKIGSNKSYAFVLENIAGGGSPNRRLNNIVVQLSDFQFLLLTIPI